MEKKRYEPSEAEKKWQKYWEKEKIYAFKNNKSKQIYSVDTPPPTVSGAMHIGHAFSYAQQDFIVRFQRMKGNDVFYPFGTDDNGLPTEKLVEKTQKVRSVMMDRQEFRELCLKTIKELKPDFIKPWRMLGMSCDFASTYSTIDKDAQKVCQKSFIDLYKKGHIFQAETPTTWCTTCRTAIAQAEFENVEMKSHFNDIVFKIGGKDLIIATTRPELISSCVAVFYHPDDKRYSKLKGKFATVPLFGFDVPILEDEAVDMEKGTGILMCCTFGDKMDIEWWHKYKLPLKISINTDGTMNDNAGKYKGMKVRDARKQIIEDLKKENLLINQKDILHPVNVHERCATEIEILKTKQWFIRVLDNKQKLIEAAEKINWFPEHMKVRYEHWVNNLQWDWSISRQRHFGVPFPVWYDKSGKVILADEKDLPVDPINDQPAGHNENLVPETDVMDTWATSSMTPHIALGWGNDNPLFKKTFPMDLRPQAHDIIRTWAFYTIVKGIYNSDNIPWKNIMISGHALDPKGKKMSKSRGNVVDPIETMNKYNADSLRFWAAGSKLGEDLPYQEKDLVTGQKFITKLWNASRFALMNLEDYDMETEELEVMDKWILSKMNKIIKETTEAFDSYEYSKTKLLTEKFFWHVYCDNYLEIVKERIYNPDKRTGKKSGQYTLYYTTLNMLKLMAPIMPHITEEIYHLYFADKENKKSIHLSSWPEYDGSLVDEKSEKIGDLFVAILAEVRKFKTSKNLSLKKPLKRLIIEARDEKQFLEVLDDLKAATQAESIEFGKGDTLLNEELMIRIEE